MGTGRMMFVVQMIIVAWYAAMGQAQDGEALARARGCFDCHSVEEHQKGPAFREVAQRYRDNVANYELHLVTVDSLYELPLRRDPVDPQGTPKSWLVLAQVGDQLHLRIFNQNNTLVVDRNEQEWIKGKAPTTLKAQLQTAALDGEALTPESRRQIIANALAAANYTHREFLIRKIKDGGRGNWFGTVDGVTMPSHSRRLAEAEVERLVDWVLGLDER